MSQTTEHPQQPQHQPQPQEPQPQPQQPTQPSGASEPTIEWYGPGQPEATQPVAPVPEPTPAQRPARNRRRWTELVVAAVVAAVVAGGTTGAIVASTDDSTTTTSSTSGSGGSPAAGSGSGPVAQSASGAVDWSKVAKAVEPSVVAISIQSQSLSAQGSGVILDTKGRVLTNNHVVAGAAQGGSVQVTLFDGRSYQATIVGTDPTTDLAVIQMKGASNLTPATLGDSEAVAVGAPVMAVGNPLGLAGTVTTGIVSALDRPVTTTSQEQGQSPFGQDSPGGAAPDTTVVTNAIQIDAAVNPGNSGGALVDSTGRVIGIPSSIASLGSTGGGSQSGSIGLGFAIPINEAKSISDQLIANGKALRPFLGVSLKDGTVQQGAAERAAATIASVTSGSPAATAGLKTGDAVIAVDGESVNSSESLVAQIRQRPVGSTVELTIVRSGKELTVKATLTKKSSN